MLTVSLAKIYMCMLTLHINSCHKAYTITHYYYVCYI